MTRVLGIIALVAAFGMISTGSLRADPVQAGDIVRFVDGPGSPGGEFGIEKVGQPGVLFTTFCLERSEYIDFNPAGFIVTGIDRNALNGGVGAGPEGDPISAQTAYLYTQFRQGTLAGYVSDATHANALQNAIWALEGDVVPSTLSGLAKDYYDIANSTTWTDIGDVRVMNLAWATSRSGFTAGTLAQSQLVMVPEPTTMALLGLALFGSIPGLRKRRKKV